MSQAKVETLIIRNASIKSLFDVVKVDFMNEKVDYLEKFLTFEEAQGVLADNQPDSEELYEELNTPT